MNLDLDRFWAVVRSKSRKPRPATHRKAPGPLEIWVEAIDEVHRTPCTPKVKVQLTPDISGLKCDVRFPELLFSEANVHGFQVYATYRSEPVFIPCNSRHLFAGDTLTVTLYISEGSTLTRLKQLGLKPSV